VSKSIEGKEPGFFQTTSGFQVKAESYLKYLDYFFITRPMLFFPGWNTLIAGYLASVGETNFIGILFTNHYQWYYWIDDLGLSMLLFMAAMGASFILNQLKDIDSDRRNKKLFLIGERYLSFRSTVWESIVLAMLSLGLSFWLGLNSFVLICLFILITGYLYNFKPFYFKNRPIWGLLINMMLGWIAFAMGWSVRSNLNIQLIWTSLPYLFLNTGLYLLTTIPDRDGDAATGKQTFCVKFGVGKTIFLSVFLYGLSVIFAFIIKDNIILIIDLLLLYWIIQMTVIKTSLSIVKSIKMAIFFFSLVICFKFPTYFFLMITIYYFTKAYYRQRFNFNYPNFSGE
jgi:4-hydroxybenzoate polyprenyltransferase